MPSSVPTTRPAPSGRRVYASAAANRTSGDTRTAAGVGEGGPVEGGGGVVVGAIVVPWGCGERAGGRNESVYQRRRVRARPEDRFFFSLSCAFLFFYAPVMASLCRLGFSSSVRGTPLAAPGEEISEVVRGVCGATGEEGEGTHERVVADSGGG